MRRLEIDREREIVDLFKLDFYANREGAQRDKQHVGLPLRHTHTHTHNRLVL